MKRILAALGWLVFAAIVVLGGRMMLGACEVRTWPVLGYAYCPVPPRQDRSGLDAERDRSAVQQSRVRRAEQQLAALPVCKPPEPEQRAEAPPPPPPPPAPPPPEEMKIPDRVEDLKGCWQSDRGDIQIVTDDERQRPIGVVRVCYCFDDRGRGTIKHTFQDGDSCRGPLRVQLEPNTLKLRHAKLPCSGRKPDHVPASIECKASEGQSAECIADQLGNNRGKMAPERFRKVSAAACDWREN